MADQNVKVRGVADIVFVLDITGSMQHCIDALKQNITTFVHSLTTRDGNNPSPLKDWRARVVGYRDFEYSNVPPFEDNPFVRTAEGVISQLAHLRADGGEDEAESLLDALYKVSTVGQTAKDGQAEDPFKWRYRSTAARVVVAFTDASYHERMSIPEARGGEVSDVIHALASNRILLSLFAPDMPCYDRLSQVHRCEYEPIPYDKSDAYGPQKALHAFTADPKNFQATLNQLAKSVSKSAETPEL
jgi:hypothetical protein